MKRLDIALVERGVYTSRERAKKAIEARQVKVNGVLAFKASQMVDEGDEIVGEAFEFVSRGALKLQHALETFKIDLRGRTVLDIGASTGGFSDMALQNGARKVYAVDTGHGQLSEKIKNDPRVENLERTNYLSLDRSRFSDADFVCIDVSFVSLTKLVEKLASDFQKSGLKNFDLVALIKPQFECGARYAKAHKGVVKDEKVRQKAVESVTGAFKAAGFVVKSVTRSPITGGDGNVEFLMWAKI